ncbi:hypothetical protein Tco_0659131 [Tanacetum coccineum]
MKCRHRYAVSSLMDTAYWVSEQINDAIKVTLFDVINDDDKRLLSIFRQIHVNLPFLEAMIHMLKRSKVLKDLLLHKEKLKKAASSVKLSEECSTFIFPVDFVVLEIDEDELVSIILGRPFLATARTVINVHKGKPSLRVKNKTIIFNIVDHDGKWAEAEEEQDAKEIYAVSFYPKQESIEPLEWKAPENLFKPSMIKPPKLELKEPRRSTRESAFLQGI